jgi:outer membrane protein W
MKHFLLTAAAALITGVASAQSFEVGINGGMSTNTKPQMAMYQGERNVWNPAYAASFNYNFTDRWQAGLSVGVTKWQRKSDWPIKGQFGDSLGNQEVDFVIADPAVSIALSFNHVIPFYERYEDFVRASLYMGVSGGAIFTGTDGGHVYSRVNPNTPAEYTYLSEFQFERGYGYTVGIQVGFNYYFGEHWGLNLDVAPKYASVKTVDPRFDRANNEYNLFYIPTTIGLRYRFGYR